MHRAGARQTALTAAFGGFVFGPMGFAWYQWLDSVTNALFGAGGGVKAILAKVGYLIGVSSLFVIALRFEDLGPMLP